MNALVQFDDNYLEIFFFHFKELELQWCTLHEEKK